MSPFPPLNRHATAALADVGTPKVQRVARALHAIAPFVQVDPRVELWRGGADGAELLQGADWVVGAIDNIGTKAELLAYCVQNNIKVFSSMGADTKSDPTRIQIADLSATHYDPLARAVRQRPSSSADADADDDPSSVPSPASSTREYSIPVVYSSEVPGDDVTLLPLASSELAKDSVDELAPLRDFRVRILPVLGPLPAIFGLHIATYVLCELVARPIERPLPVRHRKKLYERMWKDLLHRESRTASRVNKSISNYSSLPLMTADIALLYDDFVLGRSIVPPHSACVRPALVRWDPRAPLSLENCVVREMKGIAISRVFAIPDADAVYEDPLGFNRAKGYVDALGEPIDPARFRNGVVIWSSEEVWGVDAARVAQFRIAQARRFREWAL
ncbi:hypothetical protein BGW80DRAFT_1491956 [Lactifluus volemus]|nr:hypothetical protein BGW80DRAFT_1491956 [Lactifluus volemus]